LNPILEPVFGLLTEMYPESDYVLGGQLCVDKSQRGKSLAVSILKHQGVLLSLAGLDFQPRYVVTEIAAANARSLRAHEKAGYIEVHRHVSAGARSSPETWVMVALRI
jgi:RimJ/RimL family protein N-acetyltransferase